MLKEREQFLRQQLESKLARRGLKSIYTKTALMEAPKEYTRWFKAYTEWADSTF